MNNYGLLFEYYRKCFSLVKTFHFNSNVSKEQFKKKLNIADANQVVLPITHDGIQDHREKKKFDSDVLKLGFIGHETPYKGFPVLKELLADIDKSKWVLNVWGGRVGEDANLPIYFKGKFDAKTIRSVFHELDLLVVPSVWKETFSLVTLEAISYGVPVLVSNNVGAQDLVREYDDFFIYNTKDDLREKINSLVLDRTPLRHFNDAIIAKPWGNSILEHAKEVVEKIYK